MSKRKNFKEVVSCPNGCGATFKLNFKNKPKGMAKHLENCGYAFTLSQNCKIVLLEIKEKIGDNKDG